MGTSPGERVAHSHARGSSCHTRCRAWGHESARYATPRTATPRELRIGDVVDTQDGIRCLIDRAPIKSSAHEDRDGGVFYTHALVLNAGDLVHNAATGYGIMGLHFLCEGTWVEGEGWVDHYSGRWTIQGNDGVRVSIVATGKTAADFGLAS